MNVGEMIQHLQEYDLNLPVALADWNECYARPSCIEAEEMGIQENREVTVRGESGRKAERLRMVLVLGEARVTR